MHEVLNQILWFNCEIKIGKKCFLEKSGISVELLMLKILSQKDLNLWIFQRLRISSVPA